MGFSTKNNMADLNSLPPPPKNQTGMTLDQFQHLPPPPKGQTGMTLDQIQGSKTQQPATLGQGGAGELGSGFIGSFAKMGADIEGGLDQTVGRVANAVRGNGFTPTHTADAPNATADKLINESGFSQVGNAIGTIAPYFMGGGEAEGAETVATKAPGFLAKTGGYLAKAAPTIARDTAIGTAQTGNVGQGLEIGATTGVLRGVGDLAKAKLVVPSDIQKATDALNPDLSGKAKINAYKQVANGRGAQSSTILHDQGLSPSDRTVAVATRLANGTKLSDGTTLSGVKFGKDPVANLKTVGKSLNETENTLQAHPDMQAPLQKQTLVDKLGALKDEKPQDFIGDNGKIYDNVVSYAQKLINDTGDTIRDGRTARTTFDQEAQRKFPTAFKGDVIDTSTPAGNAIKTVRDAMNQHLYSTAPKGSDLKSLIGREADLLNARDISAAKAAKLNGVNWFAKFKQERPILSKALGYGAVAVGGGEVAKHLGL